MPSFADTNGDGFADLWVKGINKLYYFTNTIAKSHPIFINTPHMNPMYLVGARKPAIADINGDGKPDLFVQQILNSDTIFTFDLFENTGTSAVAGFTKKTGSDNRKFKKKNRVFVLHKMDALLIVHLYVFCLFAFHCFTLFSVK